MFPTLDNTARSASDANNDLMESGPKLTPTVFPAYLSGVGNELWRGQKLKWSPENSAFSLCFLSSFPLESRASLGLLVVRPSLARSLARIPAGDKNNRLFHYWPLASPKVHYNSECIFGGRTAGERARQKDVNVVIFCLYLPSLPLTSYMNCMYVRTVFRCSVNFILNFLPLER